MIGSWPSLHFGKILTRLAIGAALACMATTPASAQQLRLVGPWLFTGAAPATGGNVNLCRNNAPAGRFFGPQPVLTALADVAESFIFQSSCSTGVTASVTFTVGPQRTFVELECTLNGDLAAAMPGGFASVGGFGSIDGQPVVDCSPRPAQVAGVGARAVATTDRIRLCLEPGNHRASGDLGVTAAAPQNFFNNRQSVANFEIAPNPNPGLPHGLMLILLSRGLCPEDEVGRRFGDIDGDGYFSARDVNLVWLFLHGPASDDPPNPRMALADVAAPCAGMPDRADLASLMASLRRRLTDGPAPVRPACAPRPVPARRH